MKKIQKILCMFFLLSGCCAFAQKRIIERNSTSITTITADQLTSLPFAKRNLNFLLDMKNFNYSHQEFKANGVNLGKQTNFNVNAGANYFFANDISGGVDIDLNESKSINTITTTSISFITSVNATYGTTIDNSVFLYFRGGAGVGSSVVKYTSQGNTTKDKSNLTRFKGEVGLPLRLQANAFLTPYVDYRYTIDKADGSTEKTGGFGGGLKLETYLPGSQMRCDARSGYKLSDGIYNSGHSFLGFYTKGKFDFGQIKTDYTNNTIASDKENFSKIHLKAEYLYYPIKYFAFGASAGFRDNVNKQTSNNYKQTTSGFDIAPTIELNIPGENRGLNNLFIRGSYDFYTQQTKTETGTNSTTDKYNGAEFSAGFGYNLFFHKGLSFTPIFLYNWGNYKYTDSDEKEKYDGPQIHFGLRKFF